MNKKRLALVLALALVAVTLLACGGGGAQDGEANEFIGTYKAVAFKMDDLEIPVDALSEEGEEDTILEIREDGTMAMDGESGAVWKAQGDELIVTDENAGEGEESLTGVFSKAEDGQYHLIFSDDDMDMGIIFEKVEQ